MRCIDASDLSVSRSGVRVDDAHVLRSPAEMPRATQRVLSMEQLSLTPREGAHVHVGVSVNFHALERNGFWLTHQ